MADMFLSPEHEFAKSPFGVSRAPKSRMRRGRRIQNFCAPTGTEANYATYNRVMEHMFALCKRRGLQPSMRAITTIHKLCGAAIPPSQAWEWLISNFEKEHADAVAADEGMRLSMAFARGRLFALNREERDAFERLKLSKATQERQRQYANERAENGGNIDFFNSTTWKRLRFEVLAESDGCCALCGRSYREHGVALEVDHIKPRSRFPDLSLDKDNLQPLCFDCNRGKGNRDTTDWRPKPENDDAPQEDAA